MAKEGGAWKEERILGSCKGAREILLVFYDGSNPLTMPQLLDLPAKVGAKAMFFVVGQRLASAGERAILERAHRECHPTVNQS